MSDSPFADRRIGRLADYFVSRFGVVLVIVGFLGASLSACVSEHAKSPKTTGGIVLVAGSWMTLSAPFVDVHYLRAESRDVDLTIINHQI